MHWLRTASSCNLQSDHRQALDQPRPRSGLGILAGLFQQLGSKRADGLHRSPALRTHPGTVLDLTAAEYAERIFQRLQAFVAGGIAAILQKPVRGQQPGRAYKTIRIPPPGRTTGRAAGTENALVQAIKASAILR